MDHTLLFYKVFVVHFYGIFTEQNVFGKIFLEQSYWKIEWVGTTLIRKNEKTIGLMFPRKLLVSYETN